MSLIKNILAKFGYQLVRKQKSLETVSKNRAENFPLWLKEAEALGEDVNDYINRNVGNPLELLQKVVFPYLPAEASAVIEVGPGTGRFSRAIMDRIKANPHWKLYLLDHSQWIITFLTVYFEEYDNVYPILNDGLHVPVIDDNSTDLIFSNGVFIELNLSRFYTYCNDSYRVLKPGGHIIFNYIDLEFDQAWEHMKKFSENPRFSFSYFTSNVIDKVFLEKGFRLMNRALVGNSTYVVYQKPVE
ncbi:MAG: class I SAM-dependent methyltransferase [Ignavibacteria bacterium]|nr:class I SAM-dependent methyltransferase [Ignavibacteria bacterium]